MPRIYKRKSNLQSRSEVGMQNAISQVMSGNMGYLTASKAFNVLQSTLEDRVKKAKKGLPLLLKEWVGSKPHLHLNRKRN